MTHIKTFFKILGSLVLLFVLYVGAMLLYGTLNDYRPEVLIPLQSQQAAPKSVLADSVVTAIIWNVGYGGLGKESDFFYDSPNGFYYSGSKRVRHPEAVVEKNVQAMERFVAENPADFYLFQEVDSSSRRSYHKNQYARLREALPAHAASFGTNYQSGHVPIPLFEPHNVLGKILSGVASFSAYQPRAVQREQLPGEYGWPTRIFQLDRCAVFHYIPLANGKELVLVNIHNSAYDQGGFLKKQQMAYLRERWLAEYERGNYLIIGGDWNQVPGDFPFDQFMPGRGQGYEQIPIPTDYMPDGWTWAYDPKVPTNRKSRDPYQAGETFVTLIDFFLVSPNVRALQVQGIDQGFAFSDHQPVMLKAQLLAE